MTSSTLAMLQAAMQKKAPTVTADTDDPAALIEQEIANIGGGGGQEAAAPAAEAKVDEPPFDVEAAPAEVAQEETELAKAKTPNIIAVEGATLVAEGTSPKPIKLLPSQINGLSAAQLTKVAAEHGVVIDGWAGMKVAEKRLALHVFIDPEYVAKESNAPNLPVPAGGDKVSKSKVAWASKPGANADQLHKMAFEIENMGETQVIQGVEAWKARESVNFFELGGYLNAMQMNGWFGGHKDLASFVQANLGFSYRTARYFISCYDLITELEMTFEQVKTMGWCLTPDTPMLTDKGVIPLLEVQPGDRVFDPLLGGFTRVVETRAEKQDDVYAIYGKFGVLKGNYRHGFDGVANGKRILSRPDANYHIERINMDEFKVGDCVLAPRLNPGAFVDAAHVFDQKTAEFFELAGWYVAEGFVSGGKNSDNQVRITLGEDAQAEADRVFDLALMSGLGEVSIQARATEHRVTISGHSVPARFLEWFGKGAEKKKVPEGFFGVSLQSVRAFVSGLWQGDGSASEKGVHVTATISRTLAEQVRALLTRFDVYAGIHTYQPKNPKHRPIHLVTLSNADARKVFDGSVIGPDIPKGGVHSVPHYKVVKEGFMLPVRKTEIMVDQDMFIHIQTETGKFCVQGVSSYNTKLKELAANPGVLTKDNVGEWVTNAEKPVPEFIDLVKVAAGKETGGVVLDGDVPVKSMVFKLFEDQKQTVDKAIAKVKESTGTTNDAKALEYLAIEYINTGGEPQAPTAPTIVQQAAPVTVDDDSIMAYFKQVGPQRVLEMVATVFEDMVMSVEELGSWEPPADH